MRARHFLPFLLAVGAAHARDAEQTVSGDEQLAKPFWQWEHLTSDWGGTRETLADRGVEVTLEYTAEVFGNVRGGLRRGAAYGGLLEIGIDADLEKLAGWCGALCHANAIYPHGASVSDRYVGNIAAVSNIAAYDSPRLYELWLEQNLWDGAVSLRAGQLAADEDFWLTETAALFLNDAFGTPTALGENVPLPIFPIPVPGVRLRIEPWKGRYLMLGAYDGNSGPGELGDASPDAADSNEFNHFGTHWALRRDEGAVLVAEIGALFHPREADEAATIATKEPRAARGLAGVYKAGVVYHTDTFSDARDAALTELDSPLAHENPRAREGNWMLYASAEQELFREPSSDFQGLRAFLRGAGAPASRNVIEHTLQAGLRYAGALPGRDEDELGIAVSYSRISDHVRAAVTDTNRAAATHGRGLDSETVIELTYQIRVTPWLTLQPDVQCIIHPGGSRALGNALVVGLRSAIAF